MTDRRIVTAMLLAAALGLGTPEAGLAETGNGSNGSTAPAVVQADPADVSDVEIAAAGCGVAAAGSLAASYAAGPSEIALLWGGGMVVPSGSIILAVALLAQIGASTCGIGALAAPTVLWVYDQSGNIVARLTHVAGGLTKRAMIAFRPRPEQVADAYPSH